MFLSFFFHIPIQLNDCGIKTTCREMSVIIRPDKIFSGQIISSFIVRCLFGQGCDIGGTGWGLDASFHSASVPILPIHSCQWRWVYVLACANTRDHYFIHRRGLCLPSYLHLSLSLHQQGTCLSSTISMCTLERERRDQKRVEMKGTTRTVTVAPVTTFTVFYHVPPLAVMIGLQLSPVSCVHVFLFSRGSSDLSLT